MQIKVAILPQTVTRLHSRVVLVIDVIRATTRIVTLFERDAHAITLASDVEDARQIDCTECVPQFERVDSAPGDMRMMWQGEA